MKTPDILSHDVIHILLKQCNRMLKSSLYTGGSDVERFRRYSVGLSEKHRMGFVSEVKKIGEMYPWSVRAGVVESIALLLECVQSDMLESVLSAASERRKIPAFIPISIFIGEKTVVCVFECLTGLFSQCGFVPRLRAEHYSKKYYSSMNSTIVALSEYISKSRRWNLSERRIKVNFQAVSDSFPDISVHEDEFVRDEKVLWRRVSFSLDSNP